MIIIFVLSPKGQVMKLEHDVLCSMIAYSGPQTEEWINLVSKPTPIPTELIIQAHQIIERYRQRNFVEVFILPLTDSGVLGKYIPAWHRVILCNHPFTSMYTLNTFFHELGHSTASMFWRPPFDGNKYSIEYAREELIAELTAMRFMEYLGLLKYTLKASMCYLDSYFNKTLKGNVIELIKPFKESKKAFDFIMAA